MLIFECQHRRFDTKKHNIFAIIKSCEFLYKIAKTQLTSVCVHNFLQSTQFISVPHTHANIQIKRKFIEKYYFFWTEFSNKFTELNILPNTSRDSLLWIDQKYIFKCSANLTIIHSKKKIICTLKETTRTNVNNLLRMQTFW